MDADWEVVLDIPKNRLIADPIIYFYHAFCMLLASNLFLLVHSTPIVLIHCRFSPLLLKNLSEYSCHY